MLDVVFDCGRIRPHCMSVFAFVWMILCAACVLVPLVCLFACLALSWGNTTNKRLSKYHVVVCTCLLLHSFFLHEGRVSSYSFYEQSFFNSVCEKLVGKE